MIKDTIYCPYLRLVARECIQPQINPPPRNARVLLDYELFYVLSGAGMTTINGQRIKLEAGHAYLVQPGQAHFHSFDSRFEFYYLHMDIFFHQQRESSFVVPWTATLADADRRFMQERLDTFLDIPYGVLVPSRDQYLQLFEALLNMYNESPPCWRLRSQGIMIQLLEPFLDQQDYGSAATLAQRLQRAVLYMRSNIHQHLSLESIANAAHLSVYYFSRQFKQQYKVTPAHYHLQLRLEAAAARLRHGHETIQHIASELGFQTAFHFSRCFKSHYQLSPRAFRHKTASVGM